MLARSVSINTRSAGRLRAIRMPRDVTTRAICKPLWLPDLLQPLRRDVEVQSKSVNHHAVERTSPSSVQLNVINLFNYLSERTPEVKLKSTHTVPAAPCIKSSWISNAGLTCSSGAWMVSK